MFKALFPIVIGFLFLSACTTNKLSVRTEYYSHENLASFRVGTPDPNIDNPPIGERLIVHWSISQNVLKRKELHVEVTIRLHNKKEIVERFNVCSSSGQYIYTLLNERYFESGGILTYKVELKSGDCVIEEWLHQLWVDLIQFPNPNKTMI